jgi:hypothetical protein
MRAMSTRTHTITRTATKSRTHTTTVTRTVSLIGRSFAPRAGLKAVALSLVVLGLTAAVKAVIYVLTGSVALLAET